ncbi:aspartate aminotransferase [Candidatus Pacearchaeota archaeon CG_4_9_14_0_2_um_filter_39_13]|nr:aspartate aminotransferase [Candidatus Pacearchaeota archaeon]OIO42655.1 MAG: hypothetical protein AUJ64_03730 [Candidatus Pacearchaeota archaeon CG1_02_39_14]PJC44572.1 MAG: aspartate aminotransferase [Candidatus Pacearchaeota archaeon CG_4_9_14_0_2_um_filter_39_13]
MTEINDKFLFKNVDGELKVIQKALEIAQLSGTGALVEEYEASLSKFFSSKFSIAVSSGSAALHSALYCLDVKPGDEVLIQAIAPLPTILPVLTAGATPVFVDIGNGLAFDNEDLVSKINKKTKAAILAPLWGYPISYDENLKILNEKGIPLIEDAAQAHGARIGKRYIGTFGKVGCFSTHDRKLLSTGEGGFILTDDETLSVKLRKFTRLGSMNGVDYGVNYKISRLQAALGSSRLSHMEKNLEKKRIIAFEILKGIKGLGIKELGFPERSKPSYYSLVLILPWGKERNLRFLEILDSKGISSDRIKYGYDVAYNKPIFSNFKRKCKRSEKFIEDMATIPITPVFTKEEINYIIQSIRKAAHEI